VDLSICVCLDRERESEGCLSFLLLINGIRSFVIRELLRTKMRQEETIHYLKKVLGKALISCEIELAGPEFTACSQGSPFLPSAITEDMFSLELPNNHRSGLLAHNPVSVTVDNAFSPSHTLFKILCNDHKGLIYDITRTLKDYNIQVSNSNHEPFIPR